MARVFPNYDLYKIVGSPSYEVSAKTVEEMLEESYKRFGNKFKEKINLTTILVNGININYLHGMKTHLKDADEVHLVLPSAGG